MSCRRCTNSPRSEKDFTKAIVNVAPPYRGVQAVVAPAKYTPVTVYPTEPKQQQLNCHSIAPGDAVCFDNCDNQSRTIFQAKDRDPFWPSFAHPRWLSCQELYRKNSKAL